MFRPHNSFRGDKKKFCLFLSSLIWRVWLYLGVVEDCAPSCGDATAKKTHFAQVRSWVDLRRRDLRYHGVLCEGGAAHEVEDVLAVLRETGGPIRHHTLALGGPGTSAGVNGISECLVNSELT